MVQQATTGSSASSVKIAQKDILFKPDQLISDEVYVDVKNNAIRIIGNIIEDHSVQFFHVYNGTSADCLDIPELPVYSDQGCNLLLMSNSQNLNCHNGRQVNNEVWLRDPGRYRLQYVHATVGETIIPADVFIWAEEQKDSCCSNGHNGYRT